MKEIKCKRCSHKWLPRTLTKPKMCPNCKSYKWDQDKKDEKG